MGRLLLWPLVFWGKLWGPSISQFRSLFVAIILSLEPFHHLPFRWPVVSWGLHSHEHGRLWSEYHVNFMLPCSCSMCAYVKFVCIYYGYVFDCDIYLYIYIYLISANMFTNVYIFVFIYIHLLYIHTVYIYIYIFSFAWKTIESHNVFFFALARVIFWPWSFRGERKHEAAQKFLVATSPNESSAVRLVRCYLHAPQMWDDIDDMEEKNTPNRLLGACGFKYLQIFTPIWERFSFWLIFFSWVETTN